jgi:hypothetical protein
MNLEEAMRRLDAGPTWLAWWVWHAFTLFWPLLLPGAGKLVLAAWLPLALACKAAVARQKIREHRAARSRGTPA